MATGVIYKLTSPSGKAYVGQTQQNVSKRMWAHRNSTKCHAVSAAIIKYGWENMKLEILETDVPAETLNEREEEQIRLQGTASPAGYNLNRPSKQPIAGRNHGSLKIAVRAFNTANPNAQRLKQNSKRTVRKRRESWKLKREKRYEGMTEKERWAEYVKARASSKLAAKLAAIRCVGSERDPMAEWEAEYGSDTEERKAHIEYQRRVYGRAKGDSLRVGFGVHPQASSADNKDPSEQMEQEACSSTTGFLKSRPSEACARQGRPNVPDFDNESSDEEG